MLTVNNRTLAVSISNRHGEALESTWAGATCWQVEDHRALAKLSVAVGEVKHDRVSVVDLFSIGGWWCPLLVLVDSAPTGTGSEVYTPVWVILDSNPEEVLPIVRTKEHTVLFNLFYNTLWVAVHQVSKSVLCFFRFRSDKSEVKHNRIVLTCSV